VKEKDRRDGSEINKKPRQDQNGNMVAALIKAERQKSVTGTYEIQERAILPALLCKDCQEVYRVYAR